MRHRRLGNDDDWSGMDDATAHELVAEALDRGVNLFDTAPDYAATHSERLLGESLAGKRNPDQLQENLAASGLSVTAEERERLEAFWDDFTDEGRDLLPW
ncbi:MAG: aldo/keto reductase [marine benthic group bacterium]|nr:aldo/keto reductase [Gemmatimonadota bacterium]